MDKNQIRHNTLAILYDSHYKFVYDTEENKNKNLIDAELMDIPLTVFLEKLNINERDFRMANILVVNAGEAKYRQTNGVECLSLENAGLSAYESKKYLKLRYQERNEKYYSITKWTIPIASLIIAALALILTLNRKNTTNINIYLKSTDSAKETIQKIDSTKIN
jgi:hypothetical protein